jgi:hypothetical protein
MDLNVWIVVKENTVLMELYVDPVLLGTILIKMEALPAGLATQEHTWMKVDPVRALSARLENFQMTVVLQRAKRVQVILGLVMTLELWIAKLEEPSVKWESTLFWILKIPQRIIAVLLVHCAAHPSFVWDPQQLATA